MSSHREAPEISKDPVADSTDLYAFVSPDRPDTVTLIANYLPAQTPAAGPNFYEFGDDVRYEIHISNGGRAEADVTYAFRFRTEVANEETFLYNTGPIASLDAPEFNRRQFYTVTRSEGDRRGDVLAEDLPCPPCNIGPRSTPDYPSLADAAVHDLPGGGKVFAGQRADGFFVDLGSIFDLATLRPFQSAHLIPMADADGVNTLTHSNVHTIAIQVPITDLTRGGKRPRNAEDAAAVIGVWTTASRQRARIFDKDEGSYRGAGSFVQVSRLGNPLFNEVIVPMARKDEWNAAEPEDDEDYVSYVRRPEVAKLLPVLYPGVFPRLAELNESADRADLEAILLTGLPEGVVPGFQNFTGATPSDMLRLNTAITPSADPNPLGVVGGDLAGFPNGRRVFDDVVTIELRAIAGVTYPLIDSEFTPDGAAAAITDGTTPPGNEDSFPYLRTPHDGFAVPAA
ncbi:DUF4331 domain-containing protein [Jiangella alkaliphila]|uniref:DUF4331 domain-containing protein n=1 Tax=Jiangella alkaliphila TaxID=419479 RepID=A0A1H2LFA4_9ACTN|nr:DUF4331 domain-containing protein [Jiangella alkaliphila]SDU79589.1 protein of unknown function [Jiangella alkaliphila]